MPQKSRSKKQTRKAPAPRPVENGNLTVNLYRLPSQAPAPGLCH